MLEYHLGGRDISEVLAMSVTDAGDFFGDGEAATPAAHKILGQLADVGLGYLTIGRAAHHALWRRAAAAQARDPHVGETIPLTPASTSSTSRRPVCTSPTSSSCSDCSISLSTPANQ